VRDAVHKNQQLWKSMPLILHKKTLQSLYETNEQHALTITSSLVFAASMIDPVVESSSTGDTPSATDGSVKLVAASAARTSISSSSYFLCRQHHNISNVHEPGI
jgi:hypothetical protein